MGRARRTNDAARLQPSATGVAPRAAVPGATLPPRKRPWLLAIAALLLVAWLAFMILLVICR
jgi:hypothetical protein